MLFARNSFREIPAGSKLFPMMNTGNLDILWYQEPLEQDQNTWPQLNERNASGNKHKGFNCRIVTWLTGAKTLEKICPVGTNFARGPQD